MPLQLVWLGFKRYIDTARKIFFVGLTFLAVFYLFFALVKVDNKRVDTGPTIAQVEEARRLNLYKLYDKKNDPKDDEEGVLMRDMSRSFMCSVTGELCTDNPAEAYKYKEQSLSMKASSFLAEPLRHPPSSFYYWARGTMENAGFVPKTYAQGIGFAALTSFQPIWKVFRNLAYLVIVIVIMIVGFMVMFKVGGGGKNAVTLESALPKLVIALLAISFSYALAGLLIDVMYISIALIFNLMGPLSNMSSGLQTSYIGGIITGEPADLFFSLLGNIGQSDGNYYNVAGSLYSLVPWYMRTTLDAVLNNLFGALLAQWGSLGGPKTAISSDFKNPKQWATTIGRGLHLAAEKISVVLDTGKKVGEGASDVTSIKAASNIVYIIISALTTLILGSTLARSILMLLLILGMLVVFFRLWFSLIANYVEILLSILTAPLALMLEAIPGQNAFVNWIRGLAVNLGVYPVVFVVILLARSISHIAETAAPMWSPPFIVQITDQTSLQTLVSAVLIFSLPSIIKSYKKKLMPAGSFTESMGLGLGSLFVGAAPIMRGGTTIMGASGLSSAMASRISKPLGKLMGKSYDEHLGRWVTPNPEASN